MNQGSLKNAMIAFVAIVFIASGYAIKKIMQTSPPGVHAHELSYEMPRARTELPAYSLAGRRIIRNVYGPAGNAAPPMGAIAPASPLKPNAKAAAAAVAKKPDPKKTAAKTTVPRKPKLTVGVTERDRSRMSGFRVTANTSSPDQAMTGYSGSPSPVASPSAVIEEDKGKLSVGQWRSLLFNQPTAKNGSEFLAAYQAHDVDEAAFYQISEELMIDNAADRHKLGFELIKANPSVKAFTVLLKHYTEKTPEPLKSQLYSALKTYGEAGRFSILVKLLYSTDARVVQTAQQLLGQAIASMDPQVQGSGRDARSPATPIPAGQLNTFVPALKRLLTSNDATVAQQAQTLLDSIQSLKPA